VSVPGARRASAAGQPGDPASARDRDRLPAALLAYSTALAVLLLVPPYLAASVGPPEAFTLQEAIDLFTPLVVIPLAWLAFDLAGGLGRPGLVAFLVLAAAWVEGQGIHLAANAVGDAFTHDAADAFYRTVPGELNLWLDETLSHWLWHIAWVGLAVLLLAAATRGAAVDRDRVSLAAGVAGAIHGAVFFVVTVEGVTALLGLPASLLLLAWSAVAARRGLARHPVVTFFLVSTAVTLLGYLAWAAANDWTLPEFSKAGLFG
jgi:hypothetical protein